MPAILPVPNLEIGKIPFLRQQYPERPLQILDTPIRLVLLFESEHHQLIVIQWNRIQIVRAVPKSLGLRFYVYLLIIPIQTCHLSFRPLAIEFDQYNIADS